MRSHFLGAALMTAIAAFTAQARGSEEPCAHGTAGAWLTGNLLDISLTTDSLKLLNGHEDLKLKQFLEWRLASAAAEASRHVDQGPIIESAATIPNLAGGVDRAIQYFGSREITANPLLTGPTHLGNPVENLTKVRTWLSAQR